MAITTTKIIKVFLGSPGGLDEERRAANKIVDEINQSHAEHWRCQLKLVGWEETLPGYKRAQSLINKDLDQCEYFVGIMWNKWGTPPDKDGGKYSSGFEEEFERAKERCANNKMRDIVLLFKEIPDVQQSDPGKEVTKVLEFKKKCIESKEIFFRQFADPTEFEKTFRQIIENYAWQIVEEAASSADEKNSAQSDELGIGSKKGLPDEGSEPGLIDAEASTFLTEILNRTHHWDSTTPPDIARLRLIGASLSRVGNDDQVLGVHDANLLYKSRDSITFSQSEISSLCDCGIRYFDEQNTPLWHWLHANQTPYGLRQIQRRCLFGSTEEKVQALRLLALVGGAIPSYSKRLSEDYIFNSWFGDDAESAVRSAALGFFRTNGSIDEIPIIKRFLVKFSESSRNEAIDAIIQIEMRNSIDQALDRVVEFNPPSLDQSICSELFSSKSSIKTSRVISLSESSSANIRKNAYRILYEREEISNDLAEQLITDNDADTRLIGLLTLESFGKEFSDSDVRRILIRQKKPNTRGYGLLFTNTPEVEGDDVWESYQSDKLRDLSFSELKAKISLADMFENLPLKVLYRKFGGKVIREIRENLTDNFSKYVDSLNDQLSVALGGNSSEVEKTVNLKEKFQLDLISMGIDALCKQTKASDIILVRMILDSHSVDYSYHVQKYLERHGDWSDISRVIKFCSSLRAARTILGMSSVERSKSTAIAIYHLGKRRLADVFDLDVDWSIKRYIAQELSLSDIKSLDDKTLLEQISIDIDEYRKIIALKCVCALPRKRLKIVLDQYVNGEEYRYYNAIHWLDLGVALPTKEARKIARKVLNNMKN